MKHEKKEDERKKRNKREKKRNGTHSSTHTRATRTKKKQNKRRTSGFSSFFYYFPLRLSGRHANGSRWLDRFFCSFFLFKYRSLPFLFGFFGSLSLFFRVPPCPTNGKRDGRARPRPFLTTPTAANRISMIFFCFLAPPPAAQQQQPPLLVHDGSNDSLSAPCLQWPRPLAPPPGPAPHRTSQQEKNKNKRKTNEEDSSMAGQWLCTLCHEPTYRCRFGRSGSRFPLIDWLIDCFFFVFFSKLECEICHGGRVAVCEILLVIRFHSLSFCLATSSSSSSSATSATSSSGTLRRLQDVFFGYQKKRANLCFDVLPNFIIRNSYDNRCGGAFLLFFLFFSFLFVCVFYKKKENSFFLARIQRRWPSDGNWRSDPRIVVHFHPLWRTNEITHTHTHTLTHTHTVLRNSKSRSARQIDHKHPHCSVLDSFLFWCPLALSSSSSSSSKLLYKYKQFIFASSPRLALFQNQYSKFDFDT